MKADQRHERRQNQNPEQGLGRAVTPSQVAFPRRRMWVTQRPPFQVLEAWVRGGVGARPGPEPAVAVPAHRGPGSWDRPGVAPPQPHVRGRPRCADTWPGCAAVLARGRSPDGACQLVPPACRQPRPARGPQDRGVACWGSLRSRGPPGPGGGGVGGGQARRLLASSSSQLHVCLPPKFSVPEDSGGDNAGSRNGSQSVGVGFGEPQRREVWV